MQRDKNLYPLSHQHHNGLMAVLLLKKGLQKNADTLVMSDFILAAWNDELNGHFIAEEEHLKPSLLQLPQLQKLYDQMMQEHQQIRSVIDALEKKNIQTELIASFRDLLEMHIRFEERMLFPFIEQHATAEVLNEAGKKLSHLPNGNCSHFPVKFWE